MEKELEIVSSLTESSVTRSLTESSVTRSRIREFLGFFFQPHIAVYPRNGAPPPATFLGCSKEGKGLVDGEWGSLDASLSFIDMPKKHIVGSSKGLLLCCTDYYFENSRFVVCNPVTRELHVLPHPRKAYSHVALTFTCKRNNDAASLDEIHYEIFRVGIPNICAFTTTYEIDTFSSLTWEWKQSYLVSALPFLLAYANFPGFVLDDVIYWTDPRDFLVSYDRSKGEGQENIQLLELPKDGETITMDSMLGSCNGKVYYARANNADCMELWVLLDYKTAEWILKHKVSFAEIDRNNPNILFWRSPGIGHLHPHNSRLIFLVAHKSYCWYDFDTGKLHEIENRHGFCDDFLYEWPCLPSSAGPCQSHSKL